MSACFSASDARLILLALDLLFVPWHRSQLFLCIELGHRSNLIGCQGGLVAAGSARTMSWFGLSTVHTKATVTTLALPHPEQR